MELLPRARARQPWMASIGYNASFSKNLHNRSFAIQNLQIIDPAILSSGEISSSPATAR